MKIIYWSILAGACLSLAACQDRRDPVKPTTTAPASSAVAAPAAIHG